MNIGENGHLFMGSIDIADIVQRTGTPAYIYDVTTIERKIKQIQTSMHDKTELFYSLKANPNPSIVKLIYDAGANLEICSLLELEIAMQIKASPKRVLYLGPGKTKEEIRAVLEFGVEYFIIESFQELELINEMASRLKRKVKAGIRFNLNSSAKGSKLIMGGKPRQFGIDEEQAETLIDTAQKMKNIMINGIHVYNGTRILQSDVLVDNTKYILEFAQKLYNKHPFNLQYVDIGGGMGIPYFNNETELDFEQAAVSINQSIEEFHQKVCKPVKILLESGRFIVGESGVYTTKVLYTKESKGVKFAITDGGTNHHMAAGGMGNALKKNFPVKTLNKMNKPLTEQYNIAGPLCTPNDVIAKRLETPALEPGDLIGIMNAGAYGLTASPVLFLSHFIPAEVLVKENKLKIIREKGQLTGVSACSLNELLEV
ncbi:alanine racemase [Bacillus subtilis]|uniref:alanine racemase n=1 Tax=Bacillus subtilis TaxID=1423 RepID=UPI0022E7FB0D|nr:alanine racemase [Bacillus subtilis]